MKRRAARVTRNFERNLDDIRSYLEEHRSAGAFDALLDELFDTLIPTLERSPAIGFDLLARAPRSMQGLARVDALRKKLGPGASVREYISGEYLVLYALIDERVHLLAIKHHRQLSFDLRKFWAR